MDKPYGAVLPPAHLRPRTSAEEEMDAEALEAAEIRHALEKRRRDVIGEQIGATYHWTDKTFPVLYRGAAICVSRWYPERNAAVDIFKTIGPEEKAEIAFKRKTFPKMGIRYAALSYASELSELNAQLGFGR